MAWIRKEIILPGLDDDETEMVAEEILNYIVERSKRGEGKDGKKFPGYSKSYMNSFEFKATGKTSKVNLTLSGEMLDSLEILEANAGKVVIGFDEDSDMNARAEGNILGTYGSSTPNKSKARDFLDISQKEIRNLLSEIDVLPKDIQREISKASRKGALEIVNRFDFDLEEE